MSADLIERLRVNAESWRREDALEARDETEADLLSEAADALASQAALIAEAREEWRDIETAPKDGTLAITWNGRFQHVAKFDRVESEWVSSYTTLTRRLPVFPRPTHWRPLPEPPRSLQRTPAPEGKDGGAWPSGCIKPNLCGRHRACMYAISVKACRHSNRVIREEVDAASRLAPPQPQAPGSDQTEGGA